MAGVGQSVSASGLAVALSWRLQAMAAARWATAWCLAAGALVWLWRLWPRPGLVLVLSAVALSVLALGLLVSCLRARRRLPDSGVLLAALDASSHAGGLFCACADGADLRGWPLPLAPRPPRVCWRWQPSAWRLLAAVCFLVGAALVPMPSRPRHSAEGVGAAGLAATLAEEMAWMAAEGLVPPEQAEAWERQLREALAAADGTDPGTTWEALDYLQEAVGERAGEVLRQAQEWNAAMQQAETALATMAALSRREALSAAEEARLLESLDGMLREAAEAAGTALPDDLQEALAEALAEAAAGRLTPEQRQRLAELLSQCRGGAALTPEQLARLRRLSPEEVEALLEAMASCEGADPEALAAALAALEAGACSAEAILAACAGAGPGTGGVSRGPGAAALTWSEPPAPLTAPLSPTALPAASRLDLEHTRLQGISYAAPEERTAAGLSAGVLSAGGGATGARESTLLPRHRAAVEAYFGRRARAPAPPGGGP